MRSQYAQKSPHDNAIELIPNARFPTLNTPDFGAYFAVMPNSCFDPLFKTVFLYECLVI